MSAPTMQAPASKRPEIVANQQQYAPKLSETELPVSSNSLLTFSPRESLGYADLP
jgi:hypothetical protein